MQAATERRDPVATRVPLDDVLINLSPEGFHETFAADGVNVGVGGVSIRSAILPDVGAKLHCRFQSPHDGHAVDADCEVVWSHASGSNVGEFGMRFTGMTTDDQASIEELVEAWNQDLLADIEPVQAAEPPQSLNVKLHLDGVGSPIEAEAMHRAEDALVVEQSLPFLRIGTGVSEGNRRGTLQSVDLRIEDDLPRLVMTVCYEDEQASEEEKPSGDVTLLEGEAPAQPLADMHSARADASVSLPNDGPSTPLELETALPEEAEEREAVVELRYDASNEEAIESESEGAAVDDDESLVAQLKPDFRRSLRAFGSKLAPLWARVRALGLALWIKAGPRARALGARTKTFASLLGKKAGASVGTLRARITKRSTTQVKTSKRTAAPKRTKQGDAPAAPKRGVGRYVLGGVIVLLALGYFVSQLSAETPTVLKSEAAPEPVVDPEAGDETFATPEPVEAAVAPSAAPGEVPAASPYASESTATDVESAEKFESGDVGGGRSYTLRMSLPPRGMRGQDTEDGIRVVILGSNAIDGARRIASADPRISSASILNHGEEAELRLRFTEGDRPGYRIESRSSTLVITIGD
ncbi:MAG: PilZ domain-containing protein [Polyangiales bacterium]